MSTKRLLLARDERWPLVAIGAAAGLAGLIRDVPAAAAVLLVPAAGAAILFLLSNPAAWVSIFLALSLLLPPLPFSAGGLELPLHPAMFVFAVALYAAWVRLREWRLERNSLTLACFALPATLLLSLPWAFLYSGAAVGAQSLARWLLLSQGFVLLAWVAWGPRSRGCDGPGLLRLILGAALLSSAFAVVEFIYQFPATVRFSQQYIYLPEGVYRRAQGVFYDASALGNFCAMMLTLILALGPDVRKAWRIPRWLLWLPAPSLAAALLLSFSRASIVNLAVGLPVLAWLRRRSLLSARAVAAGLALAAVATLAVGLLAPEFATRYGQRLEYSVLQFFANPNEVLSTRLDTWRFLGNFILENPQHFLLGIGYKSLPYTDYFRQSLVADNMYLSVLIEAGVPGLAALLLFCAALLVHTHGLARHSDVAVSGLGCFLFAFWCGQMAQMLSGDILTYWRVTPVYFAILGVALRRSQA